MTSERKEELARKATLKIFAAILEKQNGYTPEEIKKDKLAEDCEGAELWTSVYEAVYGVCGKK